MHQLIASVPQGGPLRGRQHAVIAEIGIHMPDRVLEDGVRVQRPVLLVQADREGELAEDCPWVGGGRALKEIGDCQRHRRCRCDRRCIRHRGRQGDRRRERNRRCQGDRWRQRNRRCQGQGRGGWKDPVNHRLGLRQQQEGHQDQDNCQEQQSPAPHHLHPAHPEEGQPAGTLDRTKAAPQADQDGQDCDRHSSLDSSSNVKRHGFTEF